MSLLTHKNKLEVFLASINQIEGEEVYKQTHNELMDTMKLFLIKHHQLK